MRRITFWMCTLGAASLVGAAPVLAAEPYDPAKPGAGDSMNRADDSRMDDPVQNRDTERDLDADREMQRDTGSEQNISSAGEGEYVVEEGDTLAEIAEKELGSADEWKVIASANGIDDPKTLRVGQKLKIPAGGEASGSSKAVDESSGAEPFDSSMR